MADILQAAQQQINDAVGSVSSPPPVDPPPSSPLHFGGRTPLVGSAMGAPEPPPPGSPTEKKDEKETPLPTIGFSDKPVEKPEPLQSPPLPMAPPDPNTSPATPVAPTKSHAGDTVINAPIAKPPLTSALLSDTTPLSPGTAKSSSDYIPSPAVTSANGGPPPISSIPSPPGIPGSPPPPMVVPPPPKKSGGKGIVIAILLLLAAAIPVGVYFVSLRNRQVAEIRTKATGEWNVCDGPQGPIPCGSCSIPSVGNGTMTFGCELNCGGNAANCPGGSAGTYNIAHRWHWCNNKGTQACTQDSPDKASDFSGDLGGNGPWTINGQTLINGSGTYPTRNCGRVQVDVEEQISLSSGSTVAGGVYSYDVDCQTPPGDTPTATPPSGGSCPYISTQAQVQLEGQPWDDHITINPGAEVLMYGFHNGTGNITFPSVPDVDFIVTDPSGNSQTLTPPAAPKRATRFTPPAAGTYTFVGKTKNGSGGYYDGGQCLDSGSIIVTGPPPACDNGALFKVYDASGTNITTVQGGQRVLTRALQKSEIVILATDKGNADHARFRLQGVTACAGTEWCNSDPADNTATEFRRRITVPANYGGQTGVFEADLCDGSNPPICQ